MLDDIVFIVNPASGRDCGRLKWAKVAAILDHPQVRFSESAEHATDLARAAADEGARIVVACGGDGAVSAVANGIYQTGSSLAVLPFGTGNDFCRTLGFGADLAAAMETLSKGHAVALDAIRWRCASSSGLAVNVCGCGFDAVVAQRVNSGYRRLKGGFAYVAAVLEVLRSYRPTPLRLCVDGSPIMVAAMLCAVANARSYGGGMKVAPNAKIDDGLIDLVVVGDVSRAEFLKAFPRVFRGTHLSHPKVFSRQAHHVAIECDDVLPVLADGEIVGSTPVAFEILPKALTVIAPTPKLGAHPSQA